MANLTIGESGGQWKLGTIKIHGSQKVGGEFIHLLFLLMLSTSLKLCGFFQCAYRFILVAWIGGLLLLFIPAGFKLLILSFLIYVSNEIFT